MVVSKYPLLVALLFAGCTANLALPGDLAVSCGNDNDCPQGRRCLLDTRICVEETGACVVAGDSGLSAVEDGRVCTKSDTTPGVCYRGLCRNPPCGDGVLDQGEVCDDGNTEPGGCNPTCTKVEVCGDQITDASEACDDANVDPNDGCDACQTTAWATTVVLGNGKSASQEVPVGGGPLVIDRHGRVLVGASFCRIIEFDPSTGSSTVIAGSGTCHNDDNNGSGEHARGYDIGQPTAFALDPDGNLYFANAGRIHKLDRATGVLEWIAGVGTLCEGVGSDCPSGASPTGTALGDVKGMTITSDGTLYYSEENLYLVRRIDPSRATQQIVIGVARQLDQTSDENVPVSTIRLYAPSALANDPAGNLYVSDAGHGRIFVLDHETLKTHHVAGSGFQRQASAAGSAAKTSTIYGPTTLTYLRSGELLFDEPFYLRKITTDGILRTVAGTGFFGTGADGAVATSASIDPSALAAFDDGRPLFVNITRDAAGNNPTIDLRTVQDGTLQTLSRYRASSIPKSGQSATATPIDGLMDFARAPGGDLYLITQGEVMRVSAATGDLDVIGGLGFSRAAGTKLSDFDFSILRAIEVMPNGDLLLSDQGAQVIYRVDMTQDTVSVIAGMPGNQSFSGDNGPATAAAMADPGDIELAANGDLYVWDSGNYRIRRVRDGVITTFAGNGDVCAEPCTATVPSSGPVFYTQFLRLITVGDDIVFTDRQHHVVRRIHEGSVTTIAGGSSCAPSSNCGDGGVSTSAGFNALAGLAYDGTGLVILDSYVRRMDSVAAGTVIRQYAIVPNSTGLSGDGDAALAAGGVVGLDSTVHVFDGNVYFIDNKHLRRITPADGKITTVAGAVDPAGDGPAALGELGHPHSMTAMADGRWLIADGASGRIRMFDDTTSRLRSVFGYANGLGDAPGRLARYHDALSDPHGIAVVGATAYFSDPGLDSFQTMTLSGDPLQWTTAVYNDTAIGYRDGPIAVAQFVTPLGLTPDGADGIWVTDGGNHVIRHIATGSGLVTTLGGDPLIHDFTGDGGPVRLARFDTPSALAVSPIDGSLYIADTGNHRVRRVIATDGVVNGGCIIDTVLGSGAAANLGSGAPATDVPAESPMGVSFDGFGNLWVTTTASVRVVTAGADGIVTGEDEALTVYGAKRTTYPETVTTCLSGVNVRPGDASAYILDSCLGLMIRLDRTH